MKVVYGIRIAMAMNCARRIGTLGLDFLGGSRVKVMVVSGKCFFFLRGKLIVFLAFVFFFLCVFVFFRGFRGGGRGKRLRDVLGCFGVFCLGLIVVYDFLG